jgi:hypothetical protein
MWQTLIGPVTNIVGTWLEGKQKKAEAKAKLDVARVEAQVKKAEQDGDWEASAMNASADSFKDELWTIAFILMILACFVPAAQPYMKAGFEFLRDDCPDWLSYGILISIGASFGIKSITQMKK